MLATSSLAAVDSMKKAMTERQLKNLVYEVREKIQEYDNKLLALDVRELRGVVDLLVLASLPL